MLSLNYSREHIQEMVLKGMRNSNDEFPILKSGLYSILMETSMDSDENYNGYKKNALECNPNNISKNKNVVLILEETDSFIHSESDHLFYLWGKFHFSLQNYKQAFLWWNKIGAYNMRNDVIRELKDIKEDISKFIESYKNP